MRIGIQITKPILGVFRCSVVVGMSFLGAENRAATVKEQSSAANAGPHIQFETNFLDLGRISGAGETTGAFKFKNVGNGILHLEPPQASCDCTEATARPDTVLPGGTGEIVYTIRLDKPLKGQRIIRVHSNDATDSDVQLTLQLDFTPAYEFSPKALRISLSPDKNETQGSFTISRSDGKPLQIDRLTTTQQWITASL